jgi:hypothetical protein
VWCLCGVVCLLFLVPLCFFPILNHYLIVFIASSYNAVYIITKHIYIYRYYGKAKAHWAPGMGVSVHASGHGAADECRRLPTVFELCK